MVAKKKNFLPFNEARSLIHDECINSIKDYHEWWDANKPKVIPKYPFRVYIKEWVSWNDFLNNENTFDFNKQDWRSYEEAIMFVHALKIKNQPLWFEYVKSGKKPANIPARPDITYDRWISWKHWLGNKVSVKVEAQQDAVKVAAMLYCIHVNGRPNNVFRFGVASGGKGQLQDMYKKRPFRIMRLFRYESGYNWQSVVKSKATEWYESDLGGEYICPNVNDLLFDVDLDWVK